MKRNLVRKPMKTILMLSAVACLLFGAPAVRAESAGPAKPEAKTEAKPDAKPDAKAEAAPVRSFAKKPAVGTKATCPVSGETFAVKKTTPTATYKGRTYAFCCPDCKGDFEKEPAKFAEKAAQ
jgi:YHS domain-containing protein